MSHGSRPHTSPTSVSRQPPRRYRSLERVELRRDLPEHGLKRGDQGTIVHVFDTAHAYLVEFVNAEDGSTRAEVEGTPDQLRLAVPYGPLGRP